MAGNPDADVHLSIFAADNLVTTGKLQASSCIQIRMMIWQNMPRFDG